MITIKIIDVTFLIISNNLLLCFKYIKVILIYLILLTSINSLPNSYKMPKKTPIRPIMQRYRESCKENPTMI